MNQLLCRKKILRIMMLWVVCGTQMVHERLYAETLNYPVRWTEAIAIKPGDDIMAKLNEPIDQGLKVPAVNKNGDIYDKPVVSALDYLREVSRGYSPSYMGNSHRILAGQYLSLLNRSCFFTVVDHHVQVMSGT